MDLLDASFNETGKLYDFPTKKLLGYTSMV
jgi:hypothetical protein